MTSNEKLLNTWVLDLLKIHIPYIGYFGIWERIGKLYSQSVECDTNFMKVYVRLVDLELHF